MDTRTFLLLLAFATTVSAEAEVSCLQNWYLQDDYGDYYYCVFIGEGVVDRDGAKDQCWAIDSTLAVTYSNDDIKFVRDLLEETQRDASERGILGSWLDGDNLDGSWGWEYSDFYDTDWYDEASIPQDAGYCLFNSAEHHWAWDAMECSPDPTPSMLYVCEGQAVIAASYEGSRYTLRDDYEDLCFIDGGYVARIDSEGENEFVKQFLRDAEANVEDWFGRTHQFTLDSTVYIAGQDYDGDGTYTYDNGDALVFTDWADEPDSRHYCIALDYDQDYKWVTESCGGLHNYLCETEESAVVG